MMSSMDAHRWALAILILTGAMLFAALCLELILGMEPCPLCLMQRVWVFAAGFIAYLSVVHNPRWGIYPLLCILACATGSYFAGRQLWLMSLPPDQVPSCGPGIDYMFQNFPLSDVLGAMTQGTGDCAEPQAFLGITLPLWVLAGFAAIVFAAVQQWRAPR